MNGHGASMEDGSERCQSRPPGGGPLRGIIDDESRSEAERELAIAVVRLVKQRQEMHGRRVEPLPGINLSFAQTRMLFYLPREGSVSLTRFAELAGMTPAAATQALGPVHELGLVSRERSAEDRRVVEFGLTDLGRELLDSLRERFVDKWDRVVNGLDEDALASAAAVLGAVLRVFEQDS